MIKLKYETLIYWRFKSSSYVPYNCNYFHGNLIIDDVCYVKLGKNVYNIAELDWFTDPMGNFS